MGQPKVRTRFSRPKGWYTNESGRRASEDEIRRAQDEGRIATWGGLDDADYKAYYSLPEVTVTPENYAGNQVVHGTNAIGLPIGQALSNVALNYTGPGQAAQAAHGLYKMYKGESSGADMFSTLANAWLAKRFGVGNGLGSVRNLLSGWGNPANVTGATMRTIYGDLPAIGWQFLKPSRSETQNQE